MRQGVSHGEDRTWVLEYSVKPLSQQTKRETDCVSCLLMCVCVFKYIQCDTSRMMPISKHAEMRWGKSKC